MQPFARYSGHTLQTLFQKETTFCSYQPATALSTINFRVHPYQSKVCLFLCLCVCCDWQGTLNRPQFASLSVCLCQLVGLLNVPVSRFISQGWICLIFFFFKYRYHFYQCFHIEREFIDQISISPGHKIFVSGQPVHAITIYRKVSAGQPPECPQLTHSGQLTGPRATRNSVLSVLSLSQFGV